MVKGAVAVTIDAEEFQKIVAAAIKEFAVMEKRILAALEDFDKRHSRVSNTKLRFDVGCLRQLLNDAMAGLDEPTKCRIRSIFDGLEKRIPGVVGDKPEPRLAVGDPYIFRPFTEIEATRNLSRPIFFKATRQNVLLWSVTNGGIIVCWKEAATAYKASTGMIDSFFSFDEARDVFLFCGNGEPFGMKVEP